MIKTVFAEICQNWEGRRLRSGLTYSGDSGLGAETPAWSFQRLKNTTETRFGQKKVDQITKLEGQMMELGYGNAREARSTSLASDLWIKTCKNASKSQIDPKCELGLFLVEFSNLAKILKIGG